MIRILGTGAAATLAVVTLTLSSMPASAQVTTTPRAGTLAASSTASAAVTCTYAAKESVRLRARKTTNSTGLKLIPKGAHFNGPCVIEYGQRLGACLPGQQSDKLWTKGRYAGASGWVFTACTRQV